MRITTKGRYALKAMLQLARLQSDSPVSIKEIAGAQNISPEFLEQLFFKLKKAKVITSVRGPGGGFTLLLKPSDITVKTIFDAVGEDLDLTPCTACEEPNSVCVDQEDCLTYEVWKTIADQIHHYFRTLTLQMILEGKARQILDEGHKLSLESLTESLGD